MIGRRGGVGESDFMQIFRHIGVEPWIEMGNFRFCPTGEPYWTVCSEGLKPEGKKAKVYPTPRSAFDAFKRQVIALNDQVRYEGGGKRMVYWRQKPEMREVGECFFVYSRFRISAKPVVQSADWQLCKDGAPTDGA